VVAPDTTVLVVQPEPIACARLAEAVIREPPAGLLPISVACDTPFTPPPPAGARLVFCTGASSHLKWQRRVDQLNE
jgi:hypothetical protein